MVDGLLLKPCTDSSSRIATKNPMTHVARREKPSAYSPIGWKWAQREDAEYALNLYIEDENNRTMFGLKKSDLGGNE